MRLPKRLPSRPLGDVRTLISHGGDRADEEDNDEDGPWERNFVKSSSLQSLRNGMKKAAKFNKADKADKAAMSATM